MRKKAFIAGGVLALFILLGSTRAFAQSPSSSSIHEGAVISSVASKLHLSPDDIAAMKAEIAAGKSIKDVLAEHNITMNDIRSAIQSAYPQSKHLTNTQIAAIATKLGVDPNDVQAKINKGETFQQIMKDYSITPEKLRKVFKEEGVEFKQSKTPKKSPKKAP